MKTLSRPAESIPDCDFCAEKGIKEKAICDAPTLMGFWANMCKRHLTQYASLSADQCGFNFKTRESAKPKGGAVKLATEVSTPEEITFGDGRVVACPDCGAEKSVEPDADYEFDCEGCGAKVKVGDWMAYSNA